jgi:hypothetical protein
MFRQTEFVNCVVEFDSGESLSIGSADLSQDGMHAWKDWHCCAGHHMLHINTDLTVFGCNAQNDYLGNLGQDWNILPSPTVCNRNKCSTCIDDLMISKWRNT